MCVRNQTKSDIDTNELASLYRSGLSLAGISHMVDLTSGGVRARLIKHGVTMRAKNTGMAPGNKSAVPTADIVARYRSGQSTNQIARAVGLAGKTIIDRLKRAGEPRRTRADYSSATGAANGNWRGGRFVTDAGYVMVRASNTRRGYDFEHRVVAQRMLARPLTRAEHVHHLNGLRHDNRPENLAVLDASTHKREGWTYVKALQARIRELEGAHSENRLTAGCG